MARSLRDDPGRTGYWGLRAMSLVPHAKIAVPQVPPELVGRAGLRADLDTASRADATLVCAPAGYGKTMLLADWAHTSTGSDRSDTAWVSLDPDDNDPKRLWTSVVAALAACPSVPPDSRLHAPWMWRPSTQPEFLAELTDTVQQLPRPVRLILDDVHELVDPVALHGLHTLLRNRPTGLQLVLSSRFDPPLSLPRMRLTGRLYELRADRLRFSPPRPPPCSNDPACTSPPPRSTPCTNAPAAGPPGYAWPHSRSPRPPTVTRSSTSSPATTARSPTT